MLHSRQTGAYPELPVTFVVCSVRLLLFGLVSEWNSELFNRYPTYARTLGCRRQRSRKGRCEIVANRGPGQISLSYSGNPKIAGASHAIKRRAYSSGEVLAVDESVLPAQTGVRKSVWLTRGFVATEKWSTKKGKKNCNQVNGSPRFQAKSPSRME